MTFIDDVLEGRATIDDFDSCNDTWQDSEDDLGEFHDFAGLLWPEYALWATDHERIDGDDVLAYVIAARRRDVGLLDHLRSVKEQDATAAEVYRLAGWWAKDWEAVSQHCTEDRPA
ncbi:Rossmann-fold NAD(P)-binding domain-containing protein [Streptomyces similanensis]|uniref:Uncharacterized protein n=1 Tax=Streptomyces similanensis TaxID=1274988 RepID=A0ABP9JTI9_9ACTN|nr:hypothetical protein HUT11_00705 [Streptomyces seoulensis]